MQKMPYKHIAMHLGKTELACRLHYHQLSHGNHRRRRQSTSTNSSTSSTSSRYSMSHQLPLPGYDPHGHTHTLASQYHGGGYHTGPGGYPAMNHSPPRMQHKLLLPKPATVTPEGSPDRLQGVRLDGSLLPQPNVDSDRLHSIYNSHRGSFWSTIAHEYGNNASPGHLENLWRHNPESYRRPPTPGASPNSSTTHLLKPSPFPNYQHSTMQHPKEYAPINHMLNSMPSHDRLGYPMSSSSGGYDILPSTISSLPSLPRLDTRQPQAWSTASAGVPATAITALLNDDKCPRHGDYCGGRCFSQQ